MIRSHPRSLMGHLFFSTKEIKVRFPHGMQIFTLYYSSNRYCTISGQSITRKQTNKKKHPIYVRRSPLSDIYALKIANVVFYKWICRFSNHLLTCLPFVSRHMALLPTKFHHMKVFWKIKQTASL